MIVPVYTDLLLDYPNLVSDRTQSTLTYWRPSEASETLSGVYKFELVRYVYIYMYEGMYAIIVAHAMHM